MNQDAINVSLSPQTAELQRWVATETGKGLIDVKFFVRSNDETTVESFCGEVNQLLKSPVVSDTELI